MSDVASSAFQRLPPWRRPIGSRRALDAMFREFCAETDISPREIISAFREQRIAWARQDFMLRAYETGRFSTLTIGEFLGRDHSTVLYGIERARRRRSQIQAQKTA